MGDTLLKNSVRLEADGVEEVLGFQKLVDVRGGEGGIPSEIQPYLPPLVANDNRLQHAIPVIGAVDIAGAQGASFQITELVE